MVVPAAGAVHMPGIMSLHRDADRLGCGRRHMGVAFMRMVVIVAVVSMMVMTVPGAFAVGTGLRLESRLRFGHDQVLPAQHVGEHGVGLELQEVGLQFQRHVPVAEVICRTQQVEGRAMLGAVAHLQHRLGQRDDPQQRTVLGHQHITAAQCGSAWQHHANLAPGRIDRGEAALAAGVPVEFEQGGSLDEHGGEAGTAGNAFGGVNHGAKYRRTAKGLILGWPWLLAVSRHRSSGRTRAPPRTARTLDLRVVFLTVTRAMNRLRSLVLCCALLAAGSQAVGADAVSQTDPIAVLNQAMADSATGKLQESAQHHLWFYENAARVAPQTAELRLTFALQEWVKLARRYPPALIDIQRVRNAAARQVLSGTTDIAQPFLEMVRINELLGEAQETCRVYAQLGERSETTAAQFLLFALPAIAKSGQHLLALRYLQVDQVMQTLAAQLAGLQNLSGLSAEEKAMVESQRDRFIDLTVARVVWVLKSSSMPEQASAAASQGKELLKASRGTSLIDAALRGDPLPPA